MHAQRTVVPAAEILDHLLLGVRDLDQGIEWFEKLSGVRAVIGGSHPGRGTRNALVALQKRQYLEIIAPDPAQPAVTGGRAMPDVPTLIGWAAVSTDLESVAKRIRGYGLDANGPTSGSRARPDGRMLKWTTLSLPPTFARRGVDPVPFFIQWAPESRHPSEDSPKGCELLAISFEHPNDESLDTTLTQMGISPTIRRSASARITARLRTPKGIVQLSE